MAEVSLKGNFSLRSGFFLVENDLRRKTFSVTDDNVTFEKLVFFDTPKFEFLKNRIFIYEKRKTNRSYRYIESKKGKVKIRKNETIFKGTFPFFIIEAKRKSIFFRISSGRKIKGNLYFDVSLKNPFSETETEFADFIEADFPLSEEEIIPFKSLEIFLKENFSHKFVELKIPIVLDEEKLGLKLEKQEWTATALSKSLTKQILKAEGYLNGVLKNLDPEYVHEMRVSLRKTRSYLTVFPEVFGIKRSKLLGIEISSYALDLAQLRDLDVVENHLESFCKEINSKGREKEIIKYVQEIKKEEVEIVQRVFSSVKFKKFILRLKNFAKKRISNVYGRKPFCESAGNKLFLLKSEIKKRMKKYNKSGSPDMLHKVRISFKKFRYLFEIAEFLGGKHSPKIKKVLSAIQDCLGLHQDLLIAENILLQFSKKTDDRDILLTLGALIHLICEKKEKEIKKFVKIYREFEKMEIPIFDKGGKDESFSFRCRQSWKCNSTRPKP